MSEISETGRSQRVIREAIRKIALGRSIDRVDMSPTGSAGVGTARMIHGYVAKVHDDPADEEFSLYGGTVDVGEYPDETASSEPVIYKGVLLAGLQDNSGGVLLMPTLYSDVTMVMDAATRNSYIVNYSHADLLQFRSHQQASIGVVQTEELQQTEDTPDYNELSPTGNESRTLYTATDIDTCVKDDAGHEATIHVDAQSIACKVDKSSLLLDADKIESKVGGKALTVSEQKITIGTDKASEPLVLGQQLAQLMMDFMTECTKIMTPTLMGTMPAVNAPNFAPLISRIQKFLSQTAFTE